MPSYKDVSSEESEYEDVESSFNLTTEEDNTVEGQIRQIKSRDIEIKTEAVSNLLQNCKLDGSTVVYVDSDVEEGVVEGHIVGQAVAGKVLEGNDSVTVDNEDEMPDVVNFDAEDGQDDTH